MHYPGSYRPNSTYFEQLSFAAHARKPKIVYTLGSPPVSNHHVDASSRHINVAAMHRIILGSCYTKTGQSCLWLWSVAVDQFNIITSYKFNKTRSIARATHMDLFCVELTQSLKPPCLDLKPFKCATHWTHDMPRWHQGALAYPCL